MNARRGAAAMLSWRKRTEPSPKSTLAPPAGAATVGIPSAPRWAVARSFVVVEQLRNPQRVVRLAPPPQPPLLAIDRIDVDVVAPHPLVAPVVFPNKNRIARAVRHFVPLRVTVSLRVTLLIFGQMPAILPLVCLGEQPTLGRHGTE
jgi:hypothetical protein